MTIFLLACAGLILFSSVFYLFPRVRPGADEEDLDRANLEWFRLRRAELAEEGDDALQEDARLRLLEDEVQRTPAQKAAAQSFPVWTLLPLIAVLSGVLYYALGAASDVIIKRQLEALGEDASPEEMQQLIQSVEERSGQRPDNLHYLGLLARYYMGQAEYARAAQIYGELAEAAPGDAEALAFAAQAEYLAAGRSLSDRARLRAEQALAVNPHQRTALGLMGMASFEQQEYRAAIEYWQRLLAMEPPGSESGRMIAEVIQTAQQQLGVAEPGVADNTNGLAPEQQPLATSPGVTVSVSAPAEADISPSDTVFILARNADSNSRMPIAVQRLTGAQLPVTLRLDDSNSMAGQKLSATESVIVAVQVSPQGRPGEDSASWLGQAGPLSPTLDEQAVEILLQANTR